MNRGYLTIGEAAKLLNVTTHAIRYYDKIGLIKKKIDEQSGYRAFDYKDIYVLSTVIALRDSGVTPKDIKVLLDNHSKKNFKDTVHETLRDVQAEIKRLKLLESRLLKMLDSSDSYEEDKFNIVHQESIYYKQIVESDYYVDYSLKKAYDAYCEKGIELSQIYSDSLDYLLEEDKIVLCKKCEKHEQWDIELKRGKYLNYTFKVKDDNDIFTRIDEFFETAESDKLQLGSELILSMDLDGFIVDERTYIAKLICRIK